MERLMVQLLLPVNGWDSNMLVLVWESMMNRRLHGPGLEVLFLLPVRHEVLREHLDWRFRERWGRKRGTRISLTLLLLEVCLFDSQSLARSGEGSRTHRKRKRSPRNMFTELWYSCDNVVGDMVPRRT